MKRMLRSPKESIQMLWSEISVITNELEQKTLRMVSVVMLVMLTAGVVVDAQEKRQTDSNIDRTGLTEYKLSNGLTVMLWENRDQSDVTGYVAVRVGSVDEPKEYTGLAHYLEHMLFKGTEQIGAVDWSKEKPVYDEIIRLYDAYSTSTDATERAALAKQINEKSMEEMQYSTTRDFFTLMDEIGATDVNAFTSYDMTCYTSSFPAYQMNKWLTINADRMTKPVFRTFQAELENVFEEYNMYAGDVSTQQRDNLMATVYKGHAYERNVIGEPEHLKNPRLSKLIEFFNTWYVANNMALILVGDFETESVKPVIEKTFGSLPAGDLPVRTKEMPKFENGLKKKFDLGYFPQIYWVFDGVSVKDEDILALQFVCQLLNNGSNTGLLDKVTMDGDVSGAQCVVDARRDMGRVMVTAIPYFDPNQQSFDSNAATEKIVMAEINKLKTGDIPDWLIDAVKQEFKQQYTLAFEEGAAKMSELVECFIYDLPTDRIFTQLDEIQKLTKADIQRVAKKYFDAVPMTLTFEDGDPKVNKLPKPEIRPLQMIDGVETAYAKRFRSLPEGEPLIKYSNLADVRVVDVDQNVRLHYTKNDKNTVFSLILRYGVGTKKMPMLKYVVELMNRAGTMPDTDAQTFRRKLSEMGGSIQYGVSDSYLTIQIVGEDAHLKEILEQVSLQILMPKLDKKQFDAVKGSELSSRLTIKKMHPVWPGALREWVVYGDKSQYLDVVKFLDVYDMDELKMMTEFQKATKYALDAHYCGTLSVEAVTAALPLSEGMMPSTSPEIRDKQSYDKTQIFFLPDPKLQQANVYFYFLGEPYEIKDEVVMDGFNQYFSGGFTGLILDEIRTKRSMAYSTYGMMAAAALTGKPTSFAGYIGTQSDKVVEAVETFIHLTDSMPMHPERIDAVRTMVRQQMQSSQPSMRAKSLTYEAWQRLGYKNDPKLVHEKAMNELGFEQIAEYYKTHIQGKPMAIMIVGDPKQIDKKALGKIAKVKNVSVNTLFAPLDLD